MLIFISGSINSGKTTVSKLLSEKLNAEYINVDDIADTIPNFSLKTGLDKVMTLAIAAINNSAAKNKDIVANYVLRKKDYERLKNEVKTKEQYVITLAPRLEVAQSQRGDRKLTEWEIQRIKHHYDSGIASPKFGYIINNSDVTIEETVDQIIKIINKDKA